MTRTDDDSWDLRCGVGTTATMAAAARAVASRSLDPVIDDPFRGSPRSGDFFRPPAGSGGISARAWMANTQRRSH